MVSASGRSRNAATSSSRFAQIRDTSDLEIPVSAPSAFTRSSTLRVRDAVDVRLHHDREQRLVDPAAAFQQRREERSLAAASGSADSSSPAVVVRVRGRVPLRCVVRARSAFERGGADERGRFRVDQLLVERFGRDPDPVGDIGEFQFPEELEEGRLVKSHRALCPSVRALIGSH